MVSGLTVISVDPAPVTFEPVTSIDSISVLPECIVIFPLATLTVSLNVNTIFELTPIVVAPSVGLEELNVGPSVSATVKVAEWAGKAVSQAFSRVLLVTAT